MACWCCGRWLRIQSTSGCDTLFYPRGGREWSVVGVVNGGGVLDSLNPFVRWIGNWVPMVVAWHRSMCRW